MFPCVIRMNVRLYLTVNAEFCQDFADERLPVRRLKTQFDCHACVARGKQGIGFACHERDMP
jgi:hypothetical protein